MRSLRISSVSSNTYWLRSCGGGEGGREGGREEGDLAESSRNEGVRTKEDAGRKVTTL